MKRVSCILLALLAAALCVAAADPAIHELALDAVTRDALNAWQAPGASVVVVKDDKVVYAKGFGHRKLGRQETVTRDTLFAIASTTKAFTTAAMAMLVDEGVFHQGPEVGKDLRAGFRRGGRAASHRDAGRARDAPALV